LTLTSLIWPGFSPASWASAGETIRHGPHQGAQKSTSTGTAACSTTSANVASPASVIQGSGSWQLPQRGVPAATAGTRLRRPQLGHLVMSSDMVLPAVSALGSLKTTSAGPGCIPHP
jgi:hypothetical protein